MNRWTEAIAKLTELTRAGMLEWRRAGGASLSPRGTYGDFLRENVVGLPYFAQFADKDVAIYETRFLTEDDEDRPYWKHVVILEFVTDTGTLEFTWPVQAEARDLLEVVRVRTSGATEFLDTLLSTEVPDPKKKKK